MRKILSILVALGLIVSFSLVTALPALAVSPVWVDDGWTSQTDVDAYNPALVWQYDAFNAIQEGIDAVFADPGSGIVYVLEGNYVENITLTDGVDVLGYGAGVKTIDGGGSDSVVTANNINSATTLEGFTLTNGDYIGGGGMLNYNSSPVVTDCIFENNFAVWGGGMLNDGYSSPTLNNCNFNGNHAFVDGGGMYNADHSSPVLNTCTFHANTTDDDGGGMYNEHYSSPVLNNCTIEDGSAAVDGGGMYNDDLSAPELHTCTIDDNTAGGDGGGIYNNDQSSPTLDTSCIIKDNDAIYGAGMYNYQSSPFLTSCTFSNNVASNEGGGMYNNDYSSPTLIGCPFNTNTATNRGGGMSNVNYSSPTLTNCTFYGNTATTSHGGGMYNLTHSSPALTNCTFDGNMSTGQDGGGVCNHSDSSPTFTDCAFTGNSAFQGGGMFNYEGSSPTLTNCTFDDNTATADDGGGMYNDNYASPVVTNCTFTGNSAADAGGGMRNEFHSSPMLTNCIFWDNMDEIFDSGESYPTVTYCDVQGGYTGTGNIDADPMFVNPAADNYCLQQGSPCIDFGDNGAVPGWLTTDFEGEPRIWDGDGNWTDVVDMGIDEYILIAPMGGSIRTTYRPSDDVMFRVGGLTPGVDVEVSVVADYHWDDGDDIPPNTGDTIFAQQTFTTDSHGRIENEVIWYGPLELGEYDIAFDVYPDGTYDLPDDLIDDPNHPGFVVSSSVGGEVYPVDKAAFLMPWLGLGLLLVLAAAGLIMARRRSYR